MARPPFPKTVSEFQAWFDTDAACVRYLVESRWPAGYRCPRCEHSEAYELSSRGLLKCRKCGYQVSVTAGTVLHGTHLPIRQWFWAAYLVATYTPGISAVQLQRQLGLKRYEAAWAMLQKLRRAMVRPERDRIVGPVEVDDSYVGGLEKGRAGGRVATAIRVRGDRRVAACGAALRASAQADVERLYLGAGRSNGKRSFKRARSNGKRYIKKRQEATVSVAQEATVSVARK